MRKIFGLIVFLVLIDGRVDAQKSELDSTAIFNWPTIEGDEISAYGKFVLYMVTTYSKSVIGLGRDLIIRSTGSTDSMQYVGIGEAHFSMDGRYVALRTQSDSLLIINLATRLERRFAGVMSFKWAGRLDRDLIACLGNAGELRILDLIGQLKCSIKKVETFDFGVQGKALYAVQKIG